MGILNRGWNIAKGSKHLGYLDKIQVTKQDTRLITSEATY